MKKTLALLLAILMLCSVALVACQEKEPTETQDPFGDNFGDPADTSGDEDPDATGDDDKDPDNGNTSDYEAMEPSTYYVRYPFKVRTKATTNASSKYVLGEVSYKEEVTVKGTDGNYYVIDYVQEDGTKKDGYIYKNFLTKDQGLVTVNMFKDADGNEVAKEGTVTIDFTNLTVRTTPWYSGDISVEAFKNANLKAGVEDSWKIPNGHKVKVLGTTASSDTNKNVGSVWIYFEVTTAAGDDGTADTFKGYCPAKFVTYEGAPTVTPTEPGEDSELKPV